MRRGTKVQWTLVLVNLLIGTATSVADDGASSAAETGSENALPESASEPERSSLPRPSDMSVPAFEGALFEFLERREYIKAGWRRDKGVRDSGPFIDGTYYGTHPAVRAFYSPEIIAWLEGGRYGTIPDGAMIVKEQYPPPAMRHQGKTEQQSWDSLESWTVMVKDSQGSHDGWFWSNPAKGQKVVDNHQDFSYPLSGFGLYCVRCHASTRSPDARPDGLENEFTFAALRNIEGYPGEPILFRVDDSWHAQQDDASESGPSEPQPAPDENSDAAHPSCSRSGSVTPCTANVNPEFVQFYNSLRPVVRKDVADLPPVTHDWVVKRRDDAQEFITSNQCMSCHGGLLKPFGPTMFLPTGDTAEYGDEGWNVSPYGEWRWTPMGLAGRDPIFLAQLESERVTLKDEFSRDPEKAARLSNVLEDTCLKCHGVMGRHQFHRDSDDEQPAFTLDLCEVVAKQQQHIGRGEERYGALARDGISCMVCHRMQLRPQPTNETRPYLQYFLETSVTGNLYFGPSNEMYGPFKDKEITAYPMQHALGITPRHSEYLESSQLCATCHTVTLPAIDKPLSPPELDELNAAQVVEELGAFHHHIEQATYLEWLNSDFENEFNPDNPQAKSCQDCHMSRSLSDPERGLTRKVLPTRMAIIQDTTYPDAENLAAHEDLNVRIREEGISRHNFSGLNLLLLELFDQFDDVLGVRTHDYMTGSKLDIEHARRNFLQIAREQTADLDLRTHWNNSGELIANVTVTNKVGHRFPTGVGFRRAFLELLVVKSTGDAENAGQIVWSSGRTNSLGVLVDRLGQPLATEFFNVDAAGAQSYQPHHEEISAETQVQIYESLLCDAQDRFTTSFLHTCTTRKDNRLLPRGWTNVGPDPALTGRYLKATHPRGRAADDPRYIDGSGSDTVRYRIALPNDVDATTLQVQVTLHYQAIPPYFLHNLFQTSPDGEATRRLYFLLSHADFEDTPLEDWKLKIASATADVHSTGLRAAAE
jgi:hypothetical protein